MPSNVEPTMTFGVSRVRYGLCVDLTAGSKESRNLLQLWECSPGGGSKPYANQVWTLSTL
ncbi:hypothetical protein BDV98DRAFT_575674 [Pterulicium gracile]|uniref:Uncharacterized protein n=1 Tax=Pterulicium gracile TaxID=1884261 RepID=A0A5C3Q3L4_9AGAR|nr:hypothetical protein BDV98DRAFT_575674 [Pterula gracilis]